MSKDIISSIFILTDTPELYGSDLYREDHPTVFIKDVNALMDKLDSAEIAGLVLEVPKVMKASRRDKDRIFKYTGAYPVLRTRPDTRRNFITYLDPREHFFQNIETTVGQRKRNYERIKVSLPALLAREEDPSMAEVLEATICDISPGGCFIQTNAIIGQESFVNVRIPGLNNRPIFASVRWSRPEDAAGTTIGMGLLFIDLTDDQTQAIKAMS